MREGILAHNLWSIADTGGGLRIDLGFWRTDNCNARSETATLSLAGANELRQAREFAEALLRAVTDKERGA